MTTPSDPQPQQQDAPERIWIDWPRNPADDAWYWQHNEYGNAVEYVRADLPRATAEAELTVEQAHAELQEIAYEGAVTECRFDITPLKISGSVNISVWERNGAKDSQWRDFGGKTLNEAMNQVRAWSKSRAGKEGEANG